MTSILMIGASTRAAAFSALRAGLRPWCADLFADLDLRHACTAQQIDRSNYPHAFPELLASAPVVPWFYTGGLENHPRLVDRIAATRPLLGNPGPVLRKVRSPEWLARSAVKYDLPYPMLWRDPQPPSTGSWLVKPRGGSGGRAIAWLRGRTPIHLREYYVQEFIGGIPCSAVFRACETGTVFLGATRQLQGHDWLGLDHDFRYCGNIGPIDLSASSMAALQRWADVLRIEAGVSGLFGLDFVLRDGVPVLIEVNPRYTASIEVLEHACAFHALDPDARPGPARCVVGKAIVYAPHATAVREGPWHDFHGPMDLPDFADVPAPGTHVLRGDPILTVFARDRTEAAVTQELRRKQNLVMSHPGRSI